jgi:hypothetical protein
LVRDRFSHNGTVVAQDEHGKNATQVRVATKRFEVRERWSSDSSSAVAQTTPASARDSWEPHHEKMNEKVK